MKKLRNLPDGIKFNLRYKGTIYTLQRKEKGKAIITSDWSGRTYVKDWNLQVYQTVNKEMMRAFPITKHK